MKKLALIFLLFILIACSTFTKPVNNESLVEPSETATFQVVSGEVTALPSPEKTTAASQVPTPDEQIINEAPVLPTLAENFQESLNSIPLGEVVTIVDSSDTFTVQVLEAGISQDDVYSYTGLGGIDWQAPDMMRYMVVRIRVEYKEGSYSGPTAILSNSDFATITKGHVLEIPYNSSTIDLAVENLILSPGQSGQTYLFGLSYADDNSPLLLLNYGGEQYIFNLIADNVQPDPIAFLDPEAIPIEDQSIGNQDNPTPLNTAHVWYSSSNGQFFEVRVETVLRGLEAWRKLNDSFDYNDEAPNGYEYILPMISLQWIGGEPQPAMIEENFATLSQGENIPSAHLLFCPMPCIADPVELYQGGTALGWIPLLVREDDPNPLLVFDQNLYFSLVSEEDGSSQVAFGANAISYENIHDVNTDLTFHIPTVVNALAFSPDHAVLAAACDNRKIYLFDSVNGEDLSVLEGHTAGVKDIAFSPDGNLLASVSNDGEIFLWSTVDWALLSQMSQNGHGIFVQFLNDGTLLTGNQLGRLTFWNIDTGEAEKYTQTPREQSSSCSDAIIQNYAAAPDGSFVGAALSCGYSVFWDPSGTYKYVESDHAAESQQWPTSSAVAISLSGNTAAYGSVYYPDFRQVFVDVIDLGNAEVFTSVGTATTNITSMVFSPNNDLLLAAIADEIHVWWPGVQELGVQDYLTLDAHGTQVTAIEFSRDGELLATGDYIGLIVLWQVK
jgi:WD40 repeat protein